MPKFFKTQKMNLLYKLDKGLKILLPINESNTKNIVLTVRIMKEKDIEDVVDLMKVTFSKNNNFMKHFNVSEEDYGKVIRLRIRKSLEENLSLIILNSNTGKIIAANILFDVTKPITISNEINIFFKDMLNYQALIKKDIVGILKKDGLINDKDRLIEIVSGVDDKYINLGIVQILHDATSMLKKIHNIKFYLGTFTNPISYYVSNKIALTTNVKVNTIGIFKYDSYIKEDGSHPFLNSNFNGLLIFSLYGDLNKRIHLSNSLPFDKDYLSLEELEQLSREAYFGKQDFNLQAKL